MKADVMNEMRLPVIECEPYLWLSQTLPGKGSNWSQAGVQGWGALKGKHCDIGQNHLSEQSGKLLVASVTNMVYKDVDRR